MLSVSKDMRELINNSFKLNKIERVKRDDKVFEIEQACKPINNLWYDKNGIIMFTYNDDIYVTKYTSNNVETIYNCGFTRRAMYVPFSDNSIPIDRLCEYELKILKSV